MFENAPLSKATAPAKLPPRAGSLPVQAGLEAAELAGDQWRPSGATYQGLNAHLETHQLWKKRIKPAYLSDRPGYLSDTELRQIRRSAEGFREAIERLTESQAQPNGVLVQMHDVLRNLELFSDRGQLDELAKGYGRLDLGHLLQDAQGFDERRALTRTAAVRGLPVGAVLTPQEAAIRESLPGVLKTLEGAPQFEAKTGLFNKLLKGVSQIANQGPLPGLSAEVELRQLRDRLLQASDDQLSGPILGLKDTVFQVMNPDFNNRLMRGDMDTEIKEGLTTLWRALKQAM